MSWVEQKFHAAVRVGAALAEPRMGALRRLLSTSAGKSSAQAAIPQQGRDVVGDAVGVAEVFREFRGDRPVVGQVVLDDAGADEMPRWPRGGRADRSGGGARAAADRVAPRRRGAAWPARGDHPLALALSRNAHEAHGLRVGPAPGMRSSASRRIGAAWILSPFRAAPADVGSIHIGGCRGPSGTSQAVPLGRTQNVPAISPPAADGKPQRPPPTGAARPWDWSSRRICRRSPRWPGANCSCLASSLSGRGRVRGRTAARPRGAPGRWN
jgi:hypothetical protein